VTATVTSVVSPVRLRAEDGTVLDLPADRWLAPADPVEEALLDAVQGPVLDIGCGPGRHLVALYERAVFALGVDISPVFVNLARSRGVNVLHRSVFESIPGAGRFATALLLDGNIGIGGDPSALLHRVRTLLRPDAHILVEIERDDPGERVRLVRLEGDNGYGPWFRWTTVGPRRLERVARSAGLYVDTTIDAGDRMFVELAIGHLR
jgi:SAM-dependent methyltransferase